MGIGNGHVARTISKVVAGKRKIDVFEALASGR
jgi:hypothetical protein